MLRIKQPFLFMLCFICSCINAQTINKEEDVPVYSLPDLLISESGEKIKTKSDWERIRKPELLALFNEQVYGRTPVNKKVEVHYKLKSTDNKALNGTAIRKEVTIQVSSGNRIIEIPVLIYLPNSCAKPVPVFIGLNFSGNHTIHIDTEISISTNPGNKSNVRGSSSARWPVDNMIKRGYGLITACYSDFEPDSKDGYKDGIRVLFYEAGSQPGPSEWGAIGAWAWGLSRMLDYAETVPEIDAKKAIAIGHSRLGKTALWAGVCDTRFAMIISNNSGCGGAALSKRIFGETVDNINTTFPHWFCGNFKKYNNNESGLPVDQHQLLALIAPRPLYVASAEEDLWADPLGEYLSAYHASAVYRLYHKKGLTSASLPPVNQPVMSAIGYHIRTGKHNITSYDWERYMDFTDVFLK